MNGITPSELQRLIASEFGRHGWEYDLTVGKSIVEEAGRGEVDPVVLAQLAPTSFLATSGATRADLAQVIKRVLGGRSIVPEERITTVQINDHSYSVTLGPGARIDRSTVNVGDGTVLNIDGSAAKEDVLAAASALVSAGLAGGWNAAAARDLAEAVQARDDIDTDDIKKVALEVIEAEPPASGRVKALLTDIAASGIGGTLATGLAAALGLS